MIEKSRQEGIQSSPIGKISNSRPASFAESKSIDQESDGTSISAYASIQRFVNEYIVRSNANDMQLNNGAFTRTLYRKTGTKLPRYSAAFQLLYYAMKYCLELTKYVRFSHGLHIDSNVNYSSLKEFISAADDLIVKKFHLKMVKGSHNGRVILPIKKPAVLAAKHLYDFAVHTAITLFDSSDLDNIAKERVQRKLSFTSASYHSHKTNETVGILDR